MPPLPPWIRSIKRPLDRLVDIRRDFESLPDTEQNCVHVSLDGAGNDASDLDDDDLDDDDLDDEDDDEDEDDEEGDDAED